MDKINYPAARDRIEYVRGLPTLVLNVEIAVQMKNRKPKSLSSLDLFFKAEHIWPLIINWAIKLQMVRQGPAVNVKC